MAGPFKMKGNPMQRNYGIGGAPVRKSYRESYDEENSKVNKEKYDTFGKYEKAAKAYNTKKYGTTEPTMDLAKNEAAKQANYKKVMAKNKANRLEKSQDAQVAKASDRVAKSQKDVKATVKEVASTVTKKDLKEEKRKKVKAIRTQAKSLKGAEGLSTKDVRRMKRDDIKATRKQYKTAKKDLKA